VNEENGGAGGRAYHAMIGDEVRNHVAAIEDDHGAEKPTGFGFGGVQQQAVFPGAFQRAAEIGDLSRASAAARLSRGAAAGTSVPFRPQAWPDLTCEPSGPTTTSGTIPTATASTTSRHVTSSFTWLRSPCSDTFWRICPSG